MKALVIAPQPFFSPRGTPFSVYYRTMVTAQLGVQIDLLTYGEGQDVDIPGVRIIRIPRFSSFGNVSIGPSYLKLFLDIFIIFWTIGLLLKNRYNFVHAHEEAVFFCRFLKPLFKFKLVYDMHSSLPQQLTNFQFTSSKLLINIFRKLENSCLHAADAVITICPDLADYVDQLVADKNKHFLIENSIFDPVKTLSPCPSRNQSQHRLREIPSDKKLLVYAGTLEPYQGIDILLEAFKEVLQKDAQAYLLVVGGSGVQVAKFRERAHQLGLDENCSFTGRVNQAEAKQYSAMASILLSPRSSGTNTPLKVYEQLASGIPLVATRIYSHTQVLRDDVAILVDPNPSSMAKGILKALEPQSKAVAINARKLYEEKYSRVAYEAKMRNLLELLN